MGTSRASTRTSCGSGSKSSIERLLPRPAASTRQSSLTRFGRRATLTGNTARKAVPRADTGPTNHLAETQGCVSQSPPRWQAPFCSGPPRRCSPRAIVTVAVGRRRRRARSTSPRPSATCPVRRPVGTGVLPAQRRTVRQRPGRRPATNCGHARARQRRARRRVRCPLRVRLAPRRLRPAAPRQVGSQDRFALPRAARPNAPRFRVSHQGNRPRVPLAHPLQGLSRRAVRRQALRARTKATRDRLRPVSRLPTAATAKDTTEPGARRPRRFRRRRGRAVSRKRGPTRRQALANGAPVRCSRR